MNWPRWRKLGLRFGVGLLALCLILIVSSRLLFQSVMNSRSDQIAKALKSADLIRLEEFLENKIISQKTLEADQRALAIRSFRGSIAGGSFFSLSLCFVPHHRIVATDSRGVEFVITICFECNQAQLTGSDVFDLPVAWSSALRQFVQDNGMTVENAQ